VPEKRLSVSDAEKQGANEKKSSVLVKRGSSLGRSSKTKGTTKRLRKQRLRKPPAHGERGKSVKKKAQDGTTKSTVKKAIPKKGLSTSGTEKPKGKGPFEL